jgi:hypothetical protein
MCEILRFDLHPACVDYRLVLRVYGSVLWCELAVDGAVEGSTQSLTSSL